MITYRLEFALESPGEGVLPEFDLIGVLCHGNLEGLRSNMNVLQAELVCQMNKG